MKKVYVLKSTWMHNGDSVNGIVGIYDCLAIAQQAMTSNMAYDLKNYPYEFILGTKELDSRGNPYNLDNKSTMFYDGPNFVFDAYWVKMYNGNEEWTEDYQIYEIEEREVL